VIGRTVAAAWRCPWHEAWPDQLVSDQPFPISAEIRVHDIEAVLKMAGACPPRVGDPHT